MTNKPRRLYKKLSAYPKPLFEVVEGGNYYRDDDIRSINISNGKAEPGGGIQPATMTVDLDSDAFANTGNNTAARLTSAFANRLASDLSVDAAVIRPRFTGRLGPMMIHDEPRNMWAQLNAASWLAVPTTAPTKHNIPSGTSIPGAIKTLIQPNYLRSKIPDPIIHGGTDYLTESFPEATYGSDAAKFTADIGVLLRPNRDGSLHLLTMPYRRDHALSQINGTTAIGRRHALAPAEWNQPYDLPGDEFRVVFTADDGRVVTQTTSPTGEPTGTALVRDLDWSYVRFYTEQWRHMYALRAQSIDWAFSVNELTFDMLQLITSPVEWDRRVAGLLLTLEAGGHVYLGGDWPIRVQGTYFAEGIDETITGDEWTIKLSLAPFYHVVGNRAPDVPMTYWDQARGVWDDYPISEHWDDY